MGQLVVEFYSPSAQTRARDWKRELIEAVTTAILNVKNNDHKVFADQEISVYFTFENRKPQGQEHERTDD